MNFGTLSVNIALTANDLGLTDPINPASVAITGLPA